MTSTEERDEAALRKAIELAERDGSAPSVSRQSTSFFPEWAELLSECEEWAVSQGWRFSLGTLMQVVPPDSPLYAAQARALPVALEYGDRVRATMFIADSRLVCEFKRCQELVAQEALHNSMVATCRALGLWNAAADDGADTDDCAWQDCSQPLETIVRRLQNHAKHLEAAGLAERLHRRAREASFVTEFGLEHGLPDVEDPTSVALLREFLERVKEWGGDGRNDDMVRALVMDELATTRGDGERNLAVPKSMREAAADWFDNNQRTALIGGALLGGILGLVAAGAAVAAAGAARSARSSR